MFKFITQMFSALSASFCSAHLTFHYFVVYPVVFSCRLFGNGNAYNGCVSVLCNSLFIFCRFSQKKLEIAIFCILKRTLTRRRTLKISFSNFKVVSHIPFGISLTVIYNWNRMNLDSREIRRLNRKLFFSFDVISNVTAVAV